MAKFTIGNTFGKGRPTKEQFIKNREQEVANFLNQCIKESKHDIFSDLVDLGNISISKFYADYKPKRYKRHFNNLPRAMQTSMKMEDGVYAFTLSMSPSKMNSIYRAPKNLVYHYVFNEGHHGFYDMDLDLSEIDTSEEDYNFGEGSVNAYMQAQMKKYKITGVKKINKYITSAIARKLSKRGFN